MTLHSNRSVILWRLAAPLLAVASATILGLWVRWAIQIDPFARYTELAEGTLGGDVGIRLEQVQVRSYEGDRLVGEARVDRMDVRKDRRHMDFYGVSDGIYYGKNGSFRFSSSSAEYDANHKRMRATSGARVWNADLDVRTSAFAFHEREGRLEVPGSLQGSMYGGRIEAQNLTYAPESGSYETGPIVWEGEMESPLQDATGEKRRTSWKIKSLGSARAKGDLEFYTDVEATDGDVILKAPKVEFDRKKDVLKATGRVFYYSTDSNLVCDEVTVFRKEKRAVLTGNVTMILKPEDQEKLEIVEIQPFRPAVPDEISKARPPAPADQRTEAEKKQDEDLRSSKTVRKYPVTMIAHRIEYWYAKGNRHADITGSPQAMQQLVGDRWRYVWAFQGFYDGEAETLKLVSSEGKKDTRIKTSIGDDLVAKWFKFSTKENSEDEWEGEGIEGDVMVDEDEDIPKRDPGKQKPPPKSGGGLQGPIGGKRPPR